jgi:hypothetical protein
MSYRTVVTAFVRVCIAACIIAAANAHAQTAAVQKVEITKFGTYESQVVKAADPNVKGSVPLLTAKQLQQTKDIVGKVGVSYGVWYVTTGAASGATENGTMIVKVPGKGLDMGGKRMNEVSLPIPLKIGSELVYGFTIDTPEEHIPGQWTFEIWYGGAKMAEQSFNVQ